MIFEALQSELVIFDFYLVRSGIQPGPGIQPSYVGDIFNGPNDDIIMMLVTDRHYYRLPKNVIKIPVVEFFKLLKLRISLYDINYARRHVFF